MEEQDAKTIFDEKIAPLISGSTSNETIDIFSKTSKSYFDTLLRKEHIKERQFASMVGFKDEFFVEKLITLLLKENRLDEYYYCKKVTSNRKTGIKGRITNFFGKKKALTFGGDCVVFRKNNDIPILIIECKEYVDMTRLKELIGESRIIKSKIKHSRLTYPRIQFWVFTENLELTEEWQELLDNSDLKYKIDKIFVIRTGKRRDSSRTPNKDKLVEFKNELEKFIAKDKSKTDGICKYGNK